MRYVQCMHIENPFRYINGLPEISYISCHRNRSQRRLQGFTLVELLVVVIIIAALAALSFSVVKRVRLKANNTVSLANMRQVGVALNTYLSDNDHLPRFSGTGVSSTLVTGSTTTHAYVLQPYLGLQEPTATKQNPEIFKPPGLTSDNMNGVKNWYDLTCYAMYSTNDIHASKCYFPKGTISDSTGTDVGPFGRTGTGGNPSSDGWKMSYFDAALAKYSEKNPGKIATISMVPAMMEINAQYPGIKGSWPWKVPSKPIRDDHVNVLYFDGHVEGVAPGYFFSK